MDNMKIYDSVRAVPPWALKEIQAGRMKGKSDINPMWRIKVLTEQFGPCGIGWKYEITDKRLEKGAGNEVSAFVDINMYIKVDGQWSEAIPGTGGSSFVSQEKNGPYTSDECFKMALTDAISVSCKALGVAADVYYSSDKSKYTSAKQVEPPKPQPKQDKPSDKISPEQLTRLFAIANGKTDIAKAVIQKCGYESSKDITKADYDNVCTLIQTEVSKS